MTRTTYVMMGGKLVEKSQVAAAGKSPFVISDTMDALVHPMNGQKYDSKSRFRAETRARGGVEVGNDTMKQGPRQELDSASRREDIARAIRELGG